MKFYFSFGNIFQKSIVAGHVFYRGFAQKFILNDLLFYWGIFEKLKNNYSFFAKLTSVYFSLYWIKLLALSLEACVFVLVQKKLYIMLKKLTDIETFCIV